MEEKLAVLEKQTAEIRRGVGTVVARATKFQVVDAITFQKSAGELSAIKNKKKEVDKLRKTFTDPLDESSKKIRESKKNIMNFFEIFTNQLVKAKDIIEGKMKDYHYEQEEIARNLEKQRLLAEAKREEELRKAEEENREPEPELVKEVEIPEPVQVQKSVRSVTGSVTSFKDHYVGEVIDEKLVPKWCWEISDSIIQKAIRGGVRVIPGVRIYNDKILSTRI